MVENVIQIKSRIKINAVSSGKIKKKKKNVFAKIIIFGILLNVVAKMINI